MVVITSLSLPTKTDDYTGGTPRSTGPRNRGEVHS